MAQTPETVTDFLGKIRDLASSGLHADLKKLAAVKKTHLLERGELKSADDNVVMDAWDGYEWWCVSNFELSVILKCQEYGHRRSVVVAAVWADVGERLCSMDTWVSYFPVCCVQV